MCDVCSGRIGWSLLWTGHTLRSSLACAAGEVLEEDEYQRRKDYYQRIGTRHYYFMNIGNGEVIDAGRKVCCWR
jgi:hypothetical protein